MLRKISEKKQYGVYYTPLRVADILCAWAIKSKGEKILEPSFGGCDFLDASLNRFIQLGVDQDGAKNQLYGCDVDEQAFDFLSTRVQNPNGHFKQSDFLSLKLASFPLNQIGFDVVIGNPPYVSHHNMADEQKVTAICALKNKNIEIGGRASLWAYFVLHSMQFLKIGGRMAWVLPSSFLYADYASKVQEILASKFKKNLIINLHERLFLGSGTEEISVFVLCENLQTGDQKGKVNIVSVADLDEMKKIILEWDNDRLSIPIHYFSNKKINDAKIQDLFDILSSHPETRLLGELFDVQIGIVSGANSFFILDRSKWEENNLPETIKSYVLTKFRYAKGLSLTSSDIDALQNMGEPCLLVDTTKANIVDGPLARYLEKFPEEKISSTTTFQRRKRSGIWHRFNDNRIPNAFFPYMQNKGTWIVLNQCQLNSTNSIHRLYRHIGIDDKFIKLAAISMLSTFSQISSELEGRTYGAGVLKHEPSEAVNIRLLLPNAEEALIDQGFSEVDALLRQDSFVQARKAADDFLLSFYADEIMRDYSLFVQELIRLQSKRYPLKKRPY